MTPRCATAPSQAKKSPKAEYIAHLASLLQVRVRQPQNTLERLHRHSPILLDRDTQIPNSQHLVPIRRNKPQLNLRLDLLLIRHLRVMNECAATCSRGLVARAGVLQTFDDRRLSRTIVSHDDCDGREELDDGYAFVVEGADAPDGELV